MQEPATLADARASIERAVDLAPGYATFRIRRADIIGMQGRYEEASLDSMERRHRREATEAAEVARHHAD
jgi:hypothetical protein